ncbi:MAG: hypothetical protein HY722_09665 [Planctomycetes bacterium]|nr:hypothetical protein [Planctomycetota bacterium]
MDAPAPFGPRERAVLERLAADLVPVARDDPHGVGPGDVVEWVVRWVAPLPPDIRWGLRAAVAALQWLPVLVIDEPTRYTRLAAGERMRYLAALEAHPLYLVRSLFKVLRSFTLMGYYSRPRVTRALGFDPDRVAERSRAGHFLPGLPEGGR